MSDEQGGNAAALRLDPLLHEPVRLTILAALAPTDYVEFSTLLGIVGVSKSALSKHVSALTDAGVVVVTSSPTDRRARRIALSETGRESFNAYLRRLEDIVRSARG
ncbi:transcriptional regulator [Microbacterium sp. MYb66]|jgi:DNA-binding MarR family transcriptional regulator|uniref:transcriptional regulator n=1 Tax=Microbacterium sp. MYb66 TaxID=1848692 RepID=UPI0015E36EA5|nr:transcriptional regulator [Microbacterium sp. MYb66]MDF2697243.1 ArsR family transcriptional regulator [Labilithrix sp.]